MNTITKKICLIGSFSVGKTSLTRRFVSNTFSDNYLTTVGVKVETKTIKVSPEQAIKFVIWDIAGADELTSASKSYIQGASGYLLVADGTRRETLVATTALLEDAHNLFPNTPYIGLLNKADLVDEWDIDDKLESIPTEDWIKTSALTGENVEEAFLSLAKIITESK